MKKYILLLTVSFTLTVAHGQLNPIKNLQFQCQYITPLNCFSLGWSPPNSSLTDTLVGYNIYRNDTLYLFTVNSGIGCNPCIGDTNTAYCGFMYSPAYFWMHVTAVYNTSHIESAYTDSAYNPGCGLIIGVEESINSGKFKFFPNPFSTQTVLETEDRLVNASLTVYNSVGQTVKYVGNLVGQTVIFHRDNLPSGLYFARLTSGDKVYLGKLVITDK